MRIAITTDYFHPHRGGGVEVVVEEMARRYAEAGHEVLVLTLLTSGGPEREQTNAYKIIRHRSISLTRLVGLQLTVSPAFRWNVKRDLAAFRPDVVNVHNLFFTTALSAASAADKLGIPVVTTLHLGEVTAISGWKGKAATLYERTAGSRVLRHSDRLIAVSQAVASHSQSLFDTNLPIDVVPNGVDLSRFHPSKSPDRSDVVTGIFVGRLLPNKGPQYLLEALRLLPNDLSYRVKFAGEGPLLEDLERLVVAYQLTDHVEFLGLRSDIPELMQSADFFVRPSTLEGMPLTALEAMATGLPVIATNVAGTGEAVLHDLTGMLVEPGDITALANALETMIRSEAIRSRMGRAGRKRVEASFGWSRVADQSLATLEAARR